MKTFMKKMETWATDLSSQITKLHLKPEQIEDEMKRTQIIEKNVSNIKLEISHVNLRSDEIEKSLSFISNEYDDIKKELSAKDNEIKKIKEENNNLKIMVLNQQSQNNELEEEIRAVNNSVQLDKNSNNLELHGLVEEDEENLLEKVSKIIEKVTPGNTGIIKTFRYGRKIHRDGSKLNRPILIMFKNKTIRDNVYINKSNLIKINTEYGRIYLNENLPQNLKILLGKVNQIRKSKQYKFLWTRNGNIYVRKNENTNVISITRNSDLVKIV